MSTQNADTPLQPEKTEKPPIRYSVAGLRVLEYWGKDVSLESISMENRTQALTYHVTMQFGFNEDLTLMAVLPSIVCVPKNDPESEVCGLKVEMTFHTNNLGEYLEGDELRPPQLFLASLINMTLGSCRGILVAKNFGTVYSQSIMPVMNIEGLIPKEPFRLFPDDKQVRMTVNHARPKDE